MIKQETYIYQIYNYDNNDFFEFDILHDKIEINGTLKTYSLNENELFDLRIKQIVTIDNKPFLKFITKLVVTEYELKRLCFIAKIKGVNIYED